MSQALYRKYRSRSLDEVVGQDHVTSLLAAAIAAERVSHAYLLTGPRGVGKTSIARIIAHEINKLPYDDEAQHLDIIEIDAASNNGVEDVRDLREKVHIAPSSASRKIYIIDEVHMLSKPAFNALLKTLEEPPEHVVFILATTDADKLPATIISRVQRFNFRAITQGDAERHLKTIAEKESIAIDDDALSLIARHGRGSFRDSIGLLDQLQHLALGERSITLAEVQKALGITSDDVILRLIEGHRSGDLSSLAQAIRELESSGAQASIITNQIIAELQQTIGSHPEDVALLDSLLDVSSSSHPFIKLLAVLARSSPKTQIVVQAPVPRVQTAVANSMPLMAPEPAKAPQEVAPVESVSAEQLAADVAFDWNSFLAAAKSDAALSALLSKSGHKFENKTLTIYSGSKFNANRLLSTKQLPKLHATLDTIGARGIELAISPDPAPPADSQLASIAAIMGGGTEVELEHNA